VCGPSAAIIAEAQLSAAPPRRTTRLILDLSYTSADAAAVARHLVKGILTQIETLWPIGPPTRPPTCAVRWPHSPAR
jgi:hypothetical protein